MSDREQIAFSHASLVRGWSERRSALSPMDGAVWGAQATDPAPILAKQYPRVNKNNYFLSLAYRQILTHTLATL